MTRTPYTGSLIDTKGPVGIVFLFLRFPKAPDK